MEMEFMAEFSEGMSRDRALQIIKRKRTKRRQRLSSPFTDSYCLIDNSTPDHSPAMSSEISTSTEEDEDMANCLIMLAQSVSPVTESDHIRKKLSSRRLTEIAGGTSGFCAYECKTCNRTFPTFQALGGHRASHKKPKVSVEDKKPNSVSIAGPLTEYSDEDRDEKKSVVEDEETLIISSNAETGNCRSKGKVHECSICGSEFTSGQALGGHMRKHRPIPPSVNRTGSTINTDNTNDQIIERFPGDSSCMLSLDLNFPPPEVADDVESKFEFTSNSSQHLIISTTTLVDCHY